MSNQAEKKMKKETCVEGTILAVDEEGSTQADRVVVAFLHGENRVANPAAVRRRCSAQQAL